MLRIRSFNSIDISDFDEACSKRLVNSNHAADAMGLSGPSLSMKRKRGSKLSFAQAFTFYANYYLDETEVEFLINKMKQDGFEVDLYE